MASRFVGRDYTSLRQEIIDFLRDRLPQTWDYTNLADPVVIFAESLARVGDQLHYTIDELRRECDMATARRASSIYSYATREGYKLMLPRGSFGTLLVNSDASQSDRIEININKFDEITTTNGDNLVVAEDVHGALCSPVDQEYIDSLNKEGESIVNYASYVSNIMSRTKRIPVVLGRKEEFNFSYGDINSDSTVDLPNILIDRSLLSLVRNSTVDGEVQLLYVDDIIGSGFNPKSFTITPKFINGAITLTIEFPTNYKDLFKPSDRFTFTYVSIIDSIIEDTDDNANSIDLSNYITPSEGHESDPELSAGVKYIISLENGIKGYTEYEDPNTTRENYKKYLQDYSSLLTKDDYANYIKANKTQHCQVFDHSDMYRENKLPPNTNLIPRTVYIITDSDYDGRSELWNDLIERSSRSDCIVLSPYGKNPYTIVVKAECYLLGTSVSSITTQIKTALLKYYGDDYSSNIPDESMINYVVHKASDKVIRMDSCIMYDSTFGNIDKTFKDISTLSNSDVDSLYNAITSVSLSDTSPTGYDKSASELFNTSSSTYKKYMLGTYNYITSNYNKPVSFEYFIEHQDEEPYSEYEDYNDYMTQLYGYYWNARDNYEDYDDYINKKCGLNVEYVKYAKVSGNGLVGSFPKIYDAQSVNEDEIDSYDKLLPKQIVYGTIDKKEWDVKDTDISAFNDSDLNIFFKFNNYNDTEGTEWSLAQPLYINMKDTDFTSDKVIPGEDGISFATDSIKCAVEGGANLYTDPYTLEDSGHVLGQYYTIREVLDYVGYNRKQVDPYYIKHHYMVPVLNNVIVLVKAVSK
jgi:hypothetical protein